MEKNYIVKMLVLLFFTVCVGCGGGGSSGDTTCQDYATSESVQPLWTELIPSGTLPDERFLGASAYDTTNDKFILFGGKDGTEYFNDVWILSKASGVSGTPAWTKLTPTGTAPAGRYYAISGYNSTDKILAIYGGANADQIFTDCGDLQKPTEALHRHGQMLQ